MKLTRPNNVLSATLLTLLFAAFAVLPQTTPAHCDSVDGPVAKDVRKALRTGKPTPIFKWVYADDEQEIRKAFRETRTVRKQSPEAKKLADRYFLETVVRIHRATEGAPYTGLKPAGQQENPAIEAADAALEKDSADELVAKITEAAEEGLRQRFEEANEAQKKKDESVEEGREFVKNYVTFIHYAKGLHESIKGHGGHGEAEETAEQKHAEQTEESPHGDEALPTSALEKEHQVTALILREAEKEAAWIQKHNKVNTKRVEKMVDFFQNFTDRCHHAKEERHYFPAVEKFGSEEQSKLVAELKQEHERGRELLATIKENLSPEAQAKSSAAEAIADSFQAYVPLMRRHIEKENDLVFTPAEGYLPPALKKSMQEAFVKIERDELGEGFHEKYHNLAMELSQ